jgi:predicted nucleotidyltransferase
MSKLEEKIINFLSAYPEQEFYGQQIANKVKCSKASASLILRKLVKKGLVVKKTKGRMNFFQINSHSVAVKRFRLDTALNSLRSLVVQLKKDCLKIILFGSASRGEQAAGSDIDLFILTRQKQKVREIIKKNKRRLNLQAIIKTSSEWSEMEIKEPELYYEIKNGIILYQYVSRI